MRWALWQEVGCWPFAVRRQSTRPTANGQQPRGSPRPQRLIPQLNGILARNLNFFSFESGVSVGSIGVTLAKPLFIASMSVVGFSRVDVQSLANALVDESWAWNMPGLV